MLEKFKKIPFKKVIINKIKEIKQKTHHLRPSRLKSIIHRLRSKNK